MNKWVLEEHVCQSLPKNIGIREITQTHIKLRNRCLTSKYRLNKSDIDAKILCEAQTKSLLVDTKEKQYHERLFRVCDHELVI